MRHFLLLLFFVAGLSLSGCATLTGGETANLPELTDRFSEAMRWQDWHGAAKFVTAEQRSVFLDQFKEDPDLYVVDSEVLHIFPGAAEGTAEVVYQLQYYRLPSSRIERWKWTQKWQRQPGRLVAETLWLISNPPPPFPWNG